MIFSISSFNKNLIEIITIVIKKNIIFYNIIQIDEALKKTIQKYSFIFLFLLSKSMHFS